MWLIGVHKLKERKLEYVAFIRNIDNIKNVIEYVSKKYDVVFDTRHLLHDRDLFIIRSINDINKGDRNISLVCKYLSQDKDIWMIDEE